MKEQIEARERINKVFSTGIFANISGGYIEKKQEELDKLNKPKIKILNEISGTTLVRVEINHAISVMEKEKAEEFGR